MLSYSEYKKLNESLYGAQVLGLRQPHNLTQQPMGANTEIEESEAAENEEVKAEAEETVEAQAETEEVKAEETAETEEVKAEETAETEEVKAEETAETEEVKAEETAETEEVQTEENNQLEKILSELESLLEGKATDVVQEVKSNISKIKELLETKEMTDEEKSWWNSVNGQLGETQPGDCGHAPSTRIGWGHEGGSCG